MAYVNQELKSKLAPAIKTVCKKYGVRGTLSVRNHSTLVLTVSSGSIDFIDNFNTVNEHDRVTDKYISVNPHYYDRHFTGDALNFLNEVLTVMNSGNWDHSDSQTDYFNVGWYVDVNIGRWNKAYVVTQ